MKVRVFQVSRERNKLGARNCPWSIEWRDPASGRKQCKTIGSKKLAKEAADAKLAQLVQRECGQIENKPWQEFVDEYEANHVAGELTSEASRYSARQSLKTFGNMMSPKYVKSIDKKMLDLFVAKRRKQPGLKKGSTVSAATIRKELRTLLAALSKAEEWGYIDRVPKKPKVKGIETEKRFVREEDFDAMLVALAADDCLVSFPVGFEYGGEWTPAEWWTAFLVTAWVTGMRKAALLALKWEDVDLAAGVAVSRGIDNKGKRVHRVKLGDAAGLLAGLKGSDSRVFPWDHALSWLDNQLLAIQTAAGIKLPCVLDTPHTCTPKCHAYSMHDFRRAHATYNYGAVSDRDLQQQMGHASFSTTRSYAKYAESHQNAAYKFHLPPGAKAKLEGLKGISADACQNGGQVADTVMKASKTKKASQA